MPVPCDMIGEAIRECVGAHSARHLTVREIAGSSHGQYPGCGETVVWLEVRIDCGGDGSPTMSGAIHELEERPATMLAQR